MPAPFETMKMKKTTMWTLRCRLSLARSSGRISSIDAPVVPMKLASSAPMPRNAVLTSGVPASDAAQVDAAGDDEERSEQRDEREVLAQRVVQPLLALVSDRGQVEEHRQARDQTQDQLVAVVLPEVRERERRDRDGEQVGDERERRPQRWRENLGVHPAVMPVGTRLGRRRRSSRRWKRGWSRSGSSSGRTPSHTSAGTRSSTARSSKSIAFSRSPRAMCTSAGK